MRTFSRLSAGIALAFLLAGCAVKTGTLPSKGAETSTEKGEVTVTWDFQAASADDADPPMVSAGLVLSGAMSRHVDLATYTGKEFVTPAAGANEKDVPAGALASASVWWAGGGDELYLYREGQHLIVKHRTVDEASGFGAMETLKDIPMRASIGTVTVK